MLRKVCVGISGGVDSAVTAYLLKRKGFDVHGVFLKNWDLVDETGSCSTEKDWIDAKFVCDKLKIPVKRVDFVKQYWTEVFEATLKEYQDGTTPNPDIYCNKYIKFNWFYRYAREKLLADAIATGHYAQTSFGSFLEHYKSNSDVKLLCAVDPRKDQTFFLSQIPQNALRHTMFPVGSMQKFDVKRIATEIGLDPIVRKRESMGICFIGKRNFGDFLDEYITSRAGKFINIETGSILGQHKGISHYTIGQNASVAPVRCFVVRKLLSQNDILIAPGTDHPSMMFDLFYTKRPHWISKSPFETDNRTVSTVEFRFQHGHKRQKCDLVETGQGLLVRLMDPLRAICAGQFAVFYRDNWSRPVICKKHTKRLNLLTAHDQVSMGIITVIATLFVSVQ